MGSIPAGCWAFSSLSISLECALNQFHQGVDGTLLTFLQKNRSFDRAKCVISVDLSKTNNPLSLSILSCVYFGSDCDFLAVLFPLPTGLYVLLHEKSSCVF